MDPIFELRLQLPARGSRMRVKGLHEQLRRAILEGRLKSGVQLPPTRVLSDRLGVSRNTVIAAYELLFAEGYLHTKGRLGTVVTESLGDRQRAVSRQTDGEQRLSKAWRRPRLAAPRVQPECPRFDFQLGVPELRQFPFDTWRRIAARVTRRLPRTGDYLAPEGTVRLRQAIAQHVSLTRAVACEPDDIVVTAGAQQAFDLAARVLVDPGATVAVEDPVYPPLAAAFRNAGGRIVAVPVDEEGVIVDRIPKTARVVCVTPSHQFPLGVALSMRRRSSLLSLATSLGCTIIEDDYDSEFRFGGRPLDALQTLDCNGAVWYVGTFSKSLFPGLRLGYVVVPRWARDALRAAKKEADWHAPVLAQETLAAFMAEGHLIRHVRRMRREYEVRHNAVLEGLRKYFKGRLDPIPTIAGLHVSAKAVESEDVSNLLLSARGAGFRLWALEDFTARRRDLTGVIFGVGRIDMAGIAAALRELSHLWEGRSSRRS